MNHRAILLGAALLTGGVGWAARSAAPVPAASPASVMTPGNALLPEPTTKEAPDAAARREVAIFAGGCFWGVQGVFQHVRGVEATAAGYDGGGAATAHYGVVSTGATGHRESVRVVFDPSRITYAQLLRVFFSVALDPTQTGGQYPDEGSQYRSAVFATSPAQARVAQAYVAQLDAAHPFTHRVATEIVPDHGFFPAEPYHQNFLQQHPENGYIATFDLPKLEALRQRFPDRYLSTPTLTLAGDVTPRQG